MYQISRGCFAGRLSAVGRDALRDPWGRPYVYAVPLEGNGGKNAQCMACGGACVPAGQARKDKNLHPVSSDFDLYSLGKDGMSASALTASKSKDDIIRGRDGGFVGLASEF
jgi:general secretion pathway protein G